MTPCVCNLPPDAVSFFLLRSQLKMVVKVMQWPTALVLKLFSTMFPLWNMFSAKCNTASASMYLTKAISCVFPLTSVHSSSCSENASASFYTTSSTMSVPWFLLCSNGVMWQRPSLELICCVCVQHRLVSTAAAGRSRSSAVVKGLLASAEEASGALADVVETFHIVSCETMKSDCFLLRNSGVLPTWHWCFVLRCRCGCAGFMQLFDHFSSQKMQNAFGRLQLVEVNPIKTYCSWYWRYCVGSVFSFLFTSFSLFSAALLFQPRIHVCWFRCSELKLASSQWTNVIMNRTRETITLKIGIFTMKCGSLNLHLHFYWTNNYMTFKIIISSIPCSTPKCP